MNVDLSNVELPPFEVEITNDTLIRIGIAVVIVAALVVAVTKTIKTL